ncbi:hypothetical protein [Longimycelium tulufanense]|uniref:hypothetical protein n=1 Tax=Longimycelium tulufanense TaxID=907463 RepID=UPI00166D4DFB|nr:hypothetical protein [Longimycelium tulufanense]
MTERVLYAEPGSTWWPVLWGPAFALLGLAVEALTGGGVHWAGWTVAAAGLAVAALVWVYARRRLCSLRLTFAILRQGREELPVRRIAAADDVGVPVGARVLGGGWTPPRGTTAVPLRLDDDSTVLAWARDPAALRAAIQRVLRRP